MSLPGRNDPCPCGSGKKYKRCHGATSPIPVDSGYDRVRGLIQEANLQILEFSTRRYGPPEMQAAWDEFLDGKGGQVSGSHPDFHYFLSWFAYDWNPGGKPPLAKAYLSDRSSRNIDAGLRRLIEATLASPYSFYQALESDPGAGFKARDVLREIEVDITERGASTQIVKGMIMFARVVSLDGISFLMSTGMRPLSAVALAEIQNIREDLFSAGRIRSEAERTEILLDEEDYLRGAYFGIADAEERSVTDIRNTDGDPLVLHSLRYSIPAFQPAFDALKSLELRGTPGNEDELLTEKEITKDGEKIRARIHWLKRDKKGEQGRSVIAVISLTDKAMIVDVNSERRSKLVKKEIRKRLGDSAILTHIDVTPAEGMLKESMKKPLRGTSMPVSEKERHLLDSPELQNALKGMAQKHWDAWPDTPVPALRGMTPRQAAKDKLGRELLESLLMEYEMRSAGTGDEFTKVDVDELRRALGLAASPASAQGELIFPNQNVRPTSPDSRILPASQARRAKSARQPTPPQVQHSTWQKLYTAARRVQEMTPWEMFDDLDLIVVRDPAGGPNGHGVFMGSGGSLFGLCVYRGAAGFYTYKDLMDGKKKAASAEDLDTLDCLKLEFCSRDELEPEDLNVIRSLGLSFRGQHSWPQFRSIVPGFVPWFVTEAEAEFLTLCLNAGCYHYDRVDRYEIDESLRKGEYLVYTPVNDPPGFESRWEKWPERPTGGSARPVLDLTRLSALRVMRPAGGVAWEADVFHMPFEILDRERPYLPRMAAVCDESSGLVLETEMFPPGKPAPQLLADIVCSAAEKNGMLPETVFVKGPNEEAALSPLAKTLGFNISRRKKLHRLQQFRAAAIKHMKV